MRTKPDKAEIRKQLNHATEAFIANGGKVQLIPQGTGSKTNETLNSFKNAVFEPSHPAKRTYLNDVVAGLDARKKNNSHFLNTNNEKKPKKEIIYDDFGEPIRWKWKN